MLRTRLLFSLTKSLHSLSSCNSQSRMYSLQFQGDHHVLKRSLVCGMLQFERNFGNENEQTDNTTSVDNEKQDAMLKEQEQLIKEKDEEISDIKDKYLRSLAEIENTRNRMTRLVNDSKKFGIQSFSKDIIEVADILEKAMESVPSDALENNSNPHLSSLYSGLTMTKNELQKVFTKNGLERIEPLGEMFDPALHEALFELPGNRPGTVGSVSKVGYLLNGRTIRPALVGVVKKS